MGAAKGLSTFVSLSLPRWASRVHLATLAPEVLTTVAFCGSRTVGLKKVDFIQLA